MVKIKICGLKRLEDIEIVNKYRPDYMGFVFADTKRKVSHELARQLKELKWHSFTDWKVKTTLKI